MRFLRKLFRRISEVIFGKRLTPPGLRIPETVYELEPIINLVQEHPELKSFYLDVLVDPALIVPWAYHFPEDREILMERVVSPLAAWLWCHKLFPNDMEVMIDRILVSPAARGWIVSIGDYPIMKKRITENLFSYLLDLYEQELQQEMEEAYVS